MQRRLELRPSTLMHTSIAIQKVRDREGRNEPPAGSATLQAPAALHGSGAACRIWGPKRRHVSRAPSIEGKNKQPFWHLALPSRAHQDCEVHLLLGPDDDQEATSVCETEQTWGDTQSEQVSTAGCQWLFISLMSYSRQEERRTQGGLSGFARPCLNVTAERDLEWCDKSHVALEPRYAFSEHATVIRN